MMFTLSVYILVLLQWIGQLYSDVFSTGS